MPIQRDTKMDALKKSFTEPSFDKGKFEQVLHYLINEIGSRANVGKTVLNKVLFYCDSSYYEKTGEFMTGEHYIRLEFGPVSKHFDEVKADLIKKGIIVEKEVKGEKEIRGKAVIYHKYNSIKEPDLSKLNAGELALINKMINELGEMDRNQITDYSHGDIAFKATKENDYIDYRLVFYRTVPFSVVDGYG